jgi:hypothetical protein
MIQILLLKANNLNPRICEEIQTSEASSEVRQTHSHSKLRDNGPRSLLSSSRENQIQGLHDLINVFISRTLRKKVVQYAHPQVYLLCQFNNHSPSKNPIAQMKINDTY